MWKAFSGVLLRNRSVFSLIILFLTGFMAYEALQMQLSYEFAKILPDDDTTNIQYQSFRKKFGEDGNVMVIGYQDPQLFAFKKLHDWHQLSLDIKKIQGVKAVLSL